MAATVTSMKVKIETWRRLHALKLAPGEDFDTIIRRLLDEREAAARSGRNGARRPEKRVSA